MRRFILLLALFSVSLLSFGQNAGVVVPSLANPGPIGGTTASTGTFTTLTGTSINGPIGSSPNTGAFTTLTATSYNGVVGNTTPAAGTFTTLADTSLSSTGITNNTGLQLFNTTTTCTTATTINTPCTSAAITLPSGYSDTNYRIVCNGLGVTAFPQIQTITKSNTTFTITLNNLTAAAATYSSFDCLVAHN